MDLEHLAFSAAARYAPRGKLSKPQSEDGHTKAWGLFG